jgi:hypothetical protein
MVRFLAEARGFPSLQIALTDCGAQLPIQWVAGVKWPGREADHSPMSSAAVKNEWRSTPPCAFMACIGTTFIFCAVLTGNRFLGLLLYVAAMKR